MPLVEGIQTPGDIGFATHLGEPLTCAQIRELPDGAEVVITWNGGNGSHPYRILVDVDGHRRAEGGCNDRLLPWDGSVAFGGGLQQVSMHRVTLGWDDASRDWYDRKVPEPDHLLEVQERLRGIPEPVYTPLQLRVAGVLEDVDDRLAKTRWVNPRGPLVIEREMLAVAVNEAAKTAFGHRWTQITSWGCRPPDDVSDEDLAAAKALRDVEKRLFDLPWALYGGLPVVERDIIFEPCRKVAAEALGEQAERIRRRVRRGW